MLKQSQRILVLDHNLDAATSLAMMLSLSGHEARSAHDEREALATVLEFQPTFVLLDVGSPRMQASEIARRIREQQGTPVILVAITGFDSATERRRSQEAGFDFHLAKPVTLEMLEKIPGWNGVGS